MRTVLTGRRFTLPLQVLEPIDLDGTGSATVFLLNPTGGVLGGDRLETRVDREIELAAAEAASDVGLPDARDHRSPFQDVFHLRRPV